MKHSIYMNGVVADMTENYEGPLEKWLNYDN